MGPETSQGSRDEDPAKTMDPAKDGIQRDPGIQRIPRLNGIQGNSGAGGSLVKDHKDNGYKLERVSYVPLVVVNATISPHSLPKIVLSKLLQDICYSIVSYRIGLL